MAWDFNSLFSGKTIPWLASGTGLLQAPQLQSTIKSITSVIPSAGSTVLVPAGIVSRSIYDTGRFLSGSYNNVNANVNQFNPMVASAAKIYQPQQGNLLNLSGFTLSPVLQNAKLSTYQPSTPSSPSPTLVRYPYVSSPTGTMNYSQRYGMVLSPSYSQLQSIPKSVSTMSIPSLGSYVFGGGLSISLPWSKTRARKQKYSKRKKQQKHCNTKCRRRK